MSSSEKIQIEKQRTKQEEELSHQKSCTTIDTIIKSLAILLICIFAISPVVMNFDNNNVIRETHEGKICTVKLTGNVSNSFIEDMNIESNSRNKDNSIDISYEIPCSQIKDTVLPSNVLQELK